jgi:hypothetical protein
LLQGHEDGHFTFSSRNGLATSIDPECGRKHAIDTTGETKKRGTPFSATLRNGSVSTEILLVEFSQGNIPILRDESAEARSRVAARFRIGSSCP